MSDKPLNYRQKLFVAQLLTDPARNATAAYRRVYGCERKSANVAAYKLMQDPRIIAAIDAEGSAALKRLHLTADQVLGQIAQLATADVRDLSEFRRGACRYCHGMGFMYQRTPQQYRDAWERYRGSEEGAADPAGLFFDHKGGIGFNPHRDAHPDCPECFGVGEEYVYGKDSRELTPAAARLYAGIKYTKFGPEVRTRDQDKALELAAKTLGLLRDKESDENSDAPPAGKVSYTVVDASAEP